MNESLDRTETRISVRVDPSIYDAVQRIADEKYEGKFSMAARAAFRLLINESIARAESEPIELAAAS